MKKKTKIGCVAVVLVLLGVCAQNPSYLKLDARRVESAQLFLSPRNEMITLTEEEIAEIVPLVNDLKLSEKNRKLYYSHGYEVIVAGRDTIHLEVYISMHHLAVDAETEAGYPREKKAMIALRKYAHSLGEGSEWEGNGF